MLKFFVKSELIKETESHLGENGLEKALLCKLKCFPVKTSSSCALCYVVE